MAATPSAGASQSSGCHRPRSQGEMVMSLPPTRPAASRSGDVLDSACRATSGGGAGENVVGSSSTASRPVDHLEYGTPVGPTPHCQADNGSPTVPLDSS